MLATSMAAQVTLTPLAATGSYVTALWPTGYGGTKTSAPIRKIRECPDMARTAQQASDPANLKDAILAAFNVAIYGTEVPGATADWIDWKTPGKAVVSRFPSSGTPGVNLQYGITQVTIRPG